MMVFILATGTAYSSGDDWLWEKTAEPLDTDSTTAITVCTEENRCIIYTSE